MLTLVVINVVGFAFGTIVYIVINDLFTMYKYRKLMREEDKKNQ